MISFPVRTECSLMSDCWLGETVHYAGTHHRQHLTISTLSNSSKDQPQNSSITLIDKSNSKFSHTWSHCWVEFETEMTVPPLSFQSISSIHDPPEFKFIFNPLTLFTLYFYNLHPFHVCQYTSKSTPCVPCMLVLNIHLVRAFFRLPFLNRFFCSQKQKVMLVYFIFLLVISQ